MPGPVSPTRTMASPALYDCGWPKRHRRSISAAVSVGNIWSERVSRTDACGMSPNGHLRDWLRVRGVRRMIFDAGGNGDAVPRIDQGRGSRKPDNFIAAKLSFEPIIGLVRRAGIGDQSDLLDPCQRRPLLLGVARGLRPRVEQSQSLRRLTVTQSLIRVHADTI